MEPRRPKTRRSPAWSEEPWSSTWTFIQSDVRKDNEASNKHRGALRSIDASLQRFSNLRLSGDKSFLPHVKTYFGRFHLSSLTSSDWKQFLQILQQWSIKQELTLREDGSLVWFSQTSKTSFMDQSWQMWSGHTSSAVFQPHMWFQAEAAFGIKAENPELDLLSWISGKQFYAFKPK